MCVCVTCTVVISLLCWVLPRPDTPGSLAGVRAVDITQLTQAEAIASRRVHVPVHSHHGAAGRHLKHLSHLNVHFKVGDRAPELRSCHENSC